MYNCVHFLRNVSPLASKENIYYFICDFLSLWWLKTVLVLLIDNYYKGMLSFNIIFYAEVNQLEDPRLQWRQEQELMLKEYLVTAQDDLKVISTALLFMSTNKVVLKKVLRLYRINWGFNDWWIVSCYIQRQSIHNLCEFTTAKSLC